MPLTKVYSLVELVTVPPAVVTLSAALPVRCAGVVAVNWVALTGVMLVRATPPSVAVSGVVAAMVVGKPVPLTVIVWPPTAGPLAGTTPAGVAELRLIVGAAATMKFALPMTVAVAPITPALLLTTP